jgi:hypothetical protein
MQQNRNHIYLSSVVLLIFIGILLLSSCSHRPQEHCWADPERARIDSHDCDSDPDPAL